MLAHGGAHLSASHYGHPRPVLLQVCFQGALWGASRASAVLRLGAWMGQCQGQSPKNRSVSRRECLTGIRSSKRAGVWALAWRSEALLTRPPPPWSPAGAPLDFSCLGTRRCPPCRPGQLLAPCWAQWLKPALAHPRRARGALEASHLTLCTPRASLPDSVTAV